MIALNIPDEWLPDIEEAVEAYQKNLGRYINKSNEDIYRIERGSNVAYYDENTRRAPQIEARKKGDKNYVYFEFLPL